MHVGTPLNESAQFNSAVPVFMTLTCSEAYVQVQVQVQNITCNELTTAAVSLPQLHSCNEPTTAAMSQPQLEWGSAATQYSNLVQFGCPKQRQSNGRLQLKHASVVLLQTLSSTS